MITTTTIRSLFLCQNYSLFCSQPFCKQQLFVFLYSEVLQTTQLHTRLTELLLTRCLALLYVLKVEGERSRALAFSKTISRPLVFVQAHDVCSCSFYLLFLTLNDFCNNKFRKIFIILINDSSDSNHSSTFTFTVVAAFTKKRKMKKTKTASKVIMLC